MVKVRAGLQPGATDPAHVQVWVQQLSEHLDDIARARLLQSVEVAWTLRDRPAEDHSDWSANSDSYAAGLEIIEILADLHLGADSLIAGMLYRSVVEGKLTLDAVSGEFGDAVVSLLRGVQRMSSISDLNIDRDDPVLGQAHGQKDNIRKMLISLVDDVRVALIKLAERAVAIRSVKDEPERRLPIAREVFDVYAPLAHRLGIGQLKWELEDLSFRYLYQDAYRKIAGMLDGRRLERDKFIERVKTQLSSALRDTGTDAELLGRSKHIYSIWRKMQRKGIGFSQVYDIRAVRILVPDVKDCYAALGVVHGLWRNIPNEFDDYIANPKENGYRSLHTAVIGPEGKILEVQIRTHDMDEEAELGVCAHWRYKGSDDAANLANSYEEKIAWLRQVLDWHEETGDMHHLAEQFSSDVAQDRVYVFTPEGDVVNLARGATPLDFAYHVHTEVGHNCRGAKVNGSIVPLTYTLLTGQRVEILLGREAVPRRDWLQGGTGYLKTSRARAKVQQWFRAQARDENVAAGRHLLEREFRRLALTSIDYKRVANRVQMGTVDDMYAAVGAGDLGSAQVVHAAEGLLGLGTQNEPLASVPAASQVLHDASVQVRGVGNLMTHLAGCCKPLPGDGVLGFITQGRGVSVHRRDCARLLDLQHTTPERIVDVDWGVAPDHDFEADIAIEAYDRPGLLRDITDVLARAHVNVMSVNTQSHADGSTASMKLRAQIRDLQSLGHLLDRLSRLNNVISAVRQRDDGGADVREG